MKAVVCDLEAHYADCHVETHSTHYENYSVILWLVSTAVYVPE